MPNMIAVVAPDGKTTLSTIDLVEDLWYDYLTYRKQAEIAERRKEVLRTKQYLRASVVAFVSYVAGVANRWCAKLWQTIRADEAELASLLSDKSLSQKCEFLGKHAGMSEIPVNGLAVVCQVAADLGNLRPANEMRLFESLSLEQLLNAQDKVLSWLDAVGQKLGLSKFEDTTKHGREFASSLGGTTREESYQGYAELRKDPEAWEKELRERREWEGFGPLVGNNEGS